jgi:hypothetical protein
MWLWHGMTDGVGLISKNFLRSTNDLFDHHSATLLSLCDEIFILIQLLLDKISVERREPALYS